MSPLNESQNQTIIRSVAIFGGFVILAVIALAIWGPADNGRVDKAIQFLATAITIVIPAMVGFKLIADTKVVATEAKDEATKAVVVSRENAAVSKANAIVLKQQDSVLAEVNDQIAVAVDQSATAVQIGNETHKMVNSRNDAIVQENADLHKALIGVREELAEVWKVLAVERALIAERKNPEGEGNV